MVKDIYGRKDRLIKEKRHDAYQESSKLPEPTECPHCHAVYLEGRWTWKKTDSVKYQTLCPACRRIEDNYPAGVVKLAGPFYHEHREEIINLVKNVEMKEKELHPLERIMTISDQNGSSEITTTGVHIARRIGEALSRAYKGDFDMQYVEGDKSIRVQWER